MTGIQYSGSAPSRWGGAALFVALLSTALALGGALAHALELPNKIGLARDAYFMVQQIYVGWDRLAFLLAVQLLGIFAVIFNFRREPRVFRLAVLALTALFAAQIIFWVFTYPANRATQNWTVQPQNWETLRLQWEYSHLAGALCQLVVMIALILAALSRRHMPSQLSL